MTNFDFLLSAPEFVHLGEVAAAAEKIYSIDPAACVLNCRRAMEFAVKWMYSVDSALSMPWDDKLVSLLSTEEFRDIVDVNLMRRLEYIRKIGNCAAHDGKKVTKFEEITKTIKKDSPSRLHARRQMLKVFYPVTKVPTEGAGKKKGTKAVDMPAKMFDEIAPKYVNRQGGYTRIVKIGPRRGDGAMEVLLELV